MLQPERLVSHVVMLIRKGNGSEIVIREGRTYGDEEEVLTVCGYSKGDGIVVLRVSGKETTVEGSFDDVVKVVEERFAQEHAKREHNKVL